MGPLDVFSPENHHYLTKGKIENLLALDFETLLQSVEAERNSFEEGKNKVFRTYPETADGITQMLILCFRSGLNTNTELLSANYRHLSDHDKLALLRYTGVDGQKWFHQLLLNTPEN